MTNREAATSRRPRRQRQLALLLALALKIGLTPAAAEVTSRVESVLTYIEVRVEMRGHAANVLRQQGNGVLALQEIARPERFATLEHEASASGSPTTVAKNSRAFTQSILDDLIAPADERSYRVLEKLVAPSASSSSDSRANFFVITNIDIAPSDQTQVVAALRHLTAEALQSEGMLSIEILQLTNRPNHFALVSAWIGESLFHASTETVGAREFRRAIAATLDSPYDERLFRRVD